MTISVNRDNETEDHSCDTPGESWTGLRGDSTLVRPIFGIYRSVPEDGEINLALKPTDWTLNPEP